MLTLRASGLRAHSNQWALPGGRCDRGESQAEAALRELHEELGVKLGEGDVLGLLDDYPTRSGYLITPVVAWAAGSATLTPNPDEVASAHRIALTDIQREDAFDSGSTTDHVEGLEADVHSELDDQLAHG